MDGGLVQAGYRKVTVDDLPWLLSLAYERYGAYDPGAMLTFMLQAISSPVTLVIRNDQAFLIAAHVVPPWRPKERECHVMVLCSMSGHHWQAIKLLRASVEWARLQKCVRWRFHSETEHSVGALCRRIGAREDSPRYVVDL